MFFKKHKPLYLGLILWFFTADLIAQSKDSLRIMTYNVMYYRQYTSFCTSTNNNPTTKENALEIIVDYSLPDVLLCNEIAGHSSGLNAFTLMNSALNQNGRSYYQMANPTGNYLVNMLYFNSNKLALYAQDIISNEIGGPSLVRPIDIYTLYYKDPNLAQHQDTTFLHFVAAHLKAGSTSADEQERGRATEAVMAYLDTINATGNYFFMGDLNLYNSNEPAFQDLVNYIDSNLRFRDPVNISGNWGGSQYAILHTQSTHTSGACFSGGGMDDRFDFILASDEVMNNSDKVRYLPNSYWALGQDGMRYNGTIKSPTNNSVPFFVANALYDLSDHLPVQLDVEISLPSATGITEEKTFDIKYTNPVKNNLSLQLINNNSRQKLEIIDLSGRVLRETEIFANQRINLDISNLSRGTYFIRIISPGQKQMIKKLIKI